MADIFSPAITTLEALFTRFSWRRLCILLFISGGTLVALFAFEIYTSSMELSRLQKAATVLHTLRQVDSAHSRHDTSLAAVRQAIGRDLKTALEARRSARDRLANVLASLRKGWVGPFLAGGIVWWVLAVAGIRRLRQRRALRTFALLLTAGVLAGASGVLMATQDLWVSYWILYPVLNILILAFFLYITAPTHLSHDATKG